jgi:hypothetical protein
VLLAVLAGVLPVSSCWFGRAKALPPPVPPQVQLPTDATPPQRIEEPPEIIPPTLPPPAAPVQFPAPEPKTEPEEENRPRRRVSTPPPVQVEPPPPAPAVKVPQLAPMIGEQERRTYDTAIDALIARTTQNIGRARGRSNLSAEERDLITRAEAFLAQARDIRKVDPVAARSLAERAELLSRQASGQ